MGFDTKPGTRGPGARGNSAPAKWFMRVMMRQHRRSWTFMGMDLLMLTTTGRKTGQRHTTALSWFPDGDSWLVVASAGGSAGNPAWYRNIAANPGDLEVEMKGRTVAVTAEQLDDAAREDAWQRIIADQPRYAKYQEKTDRKIPIIRLTPVAT